MSAIHTGSTAETEAVGAELAKRLAKDSSLPPFVAMIGDLGVGKTAFTRGFVSVLSSQSNSSAVRSPTFTLVNEYKCNPPVFHFDMYRIQDEDDLISIGYYDYWNRSGICIIEWSEKITEFLPDEYLRVEIEKDDPTNPESRKITMTLFREGVQSDL